MLNNKIWNNCKGTLAVLRDMSIMTNHMITLSSLTSNQLKRAAAIQEQIEALHNELTGLLGDSGPAAATTSHAAPKTGRKKISAAGIARIKAAQKLRWAKVKAAKSSAPSASAGRKTKKMSPAARAKIAAVARARWAAIKAAGKKRL